MRWCLGHTQTIDLFVFHRYWYTSQTGIFVKRSHKLISGCTHRHGVKWGTRMASRRTFFARPFTLLTNATLRRFGFFVIVTLPIMRFPSHSIVTIFSCNRDAAVTIVDTVVTAVNAAVISSRSVALSYSRAPSHHLIVTGPE